MFIFMLAFQLSGALLLLLNSVKGGKEAVINKCFPGSNVAERDENNNCKIPSEKLQKSAHEIYLNRTAFLYLTIGYFLAAFSPTTEIRIVLVVAKMIALTFALLVFGYYLSRFCAKRIYSEDISIPYDKLEGVDTNITNQEIDDICDEIFEE